MQRVGTGCARQLDGGLPGQPVRIASASSRQALPMDRERLPPDARQRRRARAVQSPERASGCTSAPTTPSQGGAWTVYPVDRSSCAACSSASWLWP